MARRTKAQKRATRKAQRASARARRGKHLVRGHIRKSGRKRSRVRAHYSAEEMAQEGKKRKRKKKKGGKRRKSTAGRRRRSSGRRSQRRTMKRKSGSRGGYNTASRRRARKPSFSGYKRKRSTTRRLSNTRVSEGRRRRRRRGRRGAMENPLSGLELAITIFTGSLGFGAAEVADRFMALRQKAPFAGTAAAQLVPIYNDWPRLVVAVAITGVPIIVAQTLVKNAAGRSALQTFGIGAGLRTFGNILINVAARLSKSTQTGQRLFPMEIQAQALVAQRDKEVKKQELGTAGVPKELEQGVGKPGQCGTCGRTDGLGACCPGNMRPPVETSSPRTPTENAAPPPPARPIVPPTMIPPPARVTNGGNGDRNGGDGGNGDRPQQPPPPVNTVDRVAAPRDPALPPVSAFAPALTPAARPPAGLPTGIGGVPKRYVPNQQWGHEEERQPQ